MGLSKIQNLEHQCVTKVQFLRKVDGAQSSIDKRVLPPKKINSWV
jgi:hypothetical protein